MLYSSVLNVKGRREGMSLAHAILGILRDQPMTGYDLKTRCFDRSIAHFWPADQAQIYRTLERMVGEGWIAGALEMQESRPNKRVYRLTAAGEMELGRWLLSPQAHAVIREPFLVQLFFAAPLSNAAVGALLAQQAALHRQQLARYEAIPLPPLDQLKGNRDLTFQRLTLEWGIALERAYLDWCDLARGVVADLPEGVPDEAQCRGEACAPAPLSDEGAHDPQ